MRKCWVSQTLPISVNLVSSVCTSDTPVAPLGLAIGGDQRLLYTCRLSEALANPILAPDECHTRIWR